MGNGIRRHPFPDSCPRRDFAIGRNHRRDSRQNRHRQDLSTCDCHGFLASRSAPKRGGKSRRRKAAPLRVRSLERRRVLNASIQTIAVPAIAYEGSPVTATANATGQGQLNYTWSFTQGATTLATGTNPSFNFTPPDDGNFNVNLTVTDSTAVSDSKAVGLTVSNVPPQLVNVTGSTINENSFATITAKIDDPGVNDTFSIDVDWQDNQRHNHRLGRQR